MKYLSTRGGIEPVSFRQAVLMGLARDGGLLLPAEYPNVADHLDRWRTLPYTELAYEIIALFADDIPRNDLRGILARSYATFAHPEVTPIRSVGAIHLLELFHGPTLAFKDVALQFLGNLFEFLLEDSDGELNIVAATSGDTGSAAIHGVRSRKRQRIFVLHPHGRVSPVQALQMTTVPDANVFNLAVDGTFDDCQNIVKALFRNLPFRDACHLGAVNSINWARVLAQIVYFFYAAFRVMDTTGATRVRFSVPTGNFGDIFAGYVAWRMGLPIDRLVLATNENDILARFFESGAYRIGTVVSTLSPSMDIQIASNFERYLYHRSGDDATTLRRWMEDFSASGNLVLPVDASGIVDPLFLTGVGDSAGTRATIRRYAERHGTVLDPHTAVGVAVGERYLASDAPMICLATAHPAKFPDAITKATGREGLATHPSVEALKGLPQRVHRVPADARLIESFVREHLSVGDGATP